jgi:transposase
VKEGKLKEEGKIHEAIGRLKERYPRVARYYQIEYDAESKGLRFLEKAEKKAVAEELDGGYLLKTDRQDMEAEEIWRTYMLLTRAESAFRDMKSPLRERPIFHHLAHRTQAHIFLCVLAYHLLVAIEHTLREAGDHRSWETIREELSTHQVVTVVLPTTSGEELHIRRATKAEANHQDIYRKLRIPEEPMRPVRTWHLPRKESEK